jgi:flagellar FliJ protein
MRAFHFSLEKVLELKAYREQEAEIELGRAVGALSRVENKIKTAAENRRRAAAERFAGDKSAPQILNYEHYIVRLDQERDKLLEEAARAELAVEEKRNLYLEAARDRKVLDKLRERREKEYRKKMFAEETKVLDDISGGKEARLRAAGGKP